MKKVLIIVLIALVLFFTAGIMFVKLGTRAVSKNNKTEGTEGTARRQLRGHRRTV